MKFDSMQAWNDAVAWAKANANVLLPIAGIFVLVPTLAFAWFSTGLQAELEAAAATSKPDAPNWAVLPLFGQLAAIGLAISIVQLIGTLAMLALYADRGRPTVGEALTRSIGKLPTAIAAVLVMIGIGILVGIPVILLTTLIGIVAGPALGGVLGAIALIVAVFYVFTRLLLTNAAIIIDNMPNPFEAIKRSWSLTNGNGGRIAGFLIILAVGYMVLLLLTQAIAGILLGVGVIAEMDTASKAGGWATFVVGLFQGVIGAIFSVIMTGITGAIHEQLAGPSAEATARPFE